MFFLPIDKMEIYTKKTPDQIRQILNDKIARPGIKNYRFWNKDLIKGKLFEGDADEAGFKLRMIIKYWNAFLPVITGKFGSEESGTKVFVKMRMTKSDIVILSFISAALILSAVSLFFPEINIALPVKIEFTALFTAAVVIMMSLYKAEARKAKKALLQLLDENNERKEKE